MKTFEGIKTKGYLQLILDSAPYTIISTDLDGRITSFNKEAEKMYGYKEDEILGKHARILQPEEVPQDLNKEIYEAMLQKEGWEGELLNIRKTGEVFPVYLRTRSIKDEKSSPIGLLSVALDITERQRNREKLEDYARKLEESNKTKELFIDIMRHDLVNPLGVIANYSELLMEDETKEDRIKELDTIRRNAQRLVKMVQDMGMFAKLESGEVGRYFIRDLKDIMNNVIERYRGGLEETGARIEFNQNGEYLVYANSFIDGVFSNIISNAIKYGPKKGMVSVRIQGKGDAWRVSIADQGPGVPDDSKKEIFERFKRRKKGKIKGTGLGLAIVKRVADMHRGKVWVEDNEGGGSIFYFEIPKARGV